MELKIKSEQELEKLNTRNLLRYYKAERKRFYQFVASHTCECCGETDWYINTVLYKKEEKMYNDWNDYLVKIKGVLNKREHLIRK